MRAFSGLISKRNPEGMQVTSRTATMGIRGTSFDARQCRVVELRFFGGLNIPEAADALGVSTATVEREWAMAKAWLHRRLSAPSEPAAE